jgi:predicted Zn-dependent protease
MYDTFKRMSSETMFATQGANPYMQTHPMPADRVAALEVVAKASPYWDKKDSPEMQQRHDLMRAKLAGFLDRSDTVARRYPLNDHSLAARYARAIATYRRADVQKALQEIDELIHAQPNNPYFHELKGQALLESGHAAEAVAPLRRAVQLSPNPALIQIMLGQAMIATGDKKYADEAVNLLRSALIREPEAISAYAQLAMAYGKKGDIAHADLASAEAAFYRGDYSAAAMLATRAKTKLPIGSPAWVRADDIVSAKAKTKTN